MNSSTHTTLKPSLILSTLLGCIVLSSCASARYDLASGGSGSNAAAPSSAAKGSVENRQAQSADTAVQSRPQLIKTAEMSLTVKSIDRSVQAISNIVKQKQGDVFKFEDKKPQRDSTRHTASIDIKVPQEQLESTLDELTKLGTTQHRTLKAEDVTDQLVDSEARLRNLRQQESSLLKIMERSGSVGDVLKVAQELSNVRESIERLDAQLKSLRNRVAYSTIMLTMEEEVAGKALTRPLGSEIQETWDSATTSVGKFTLSLLRLSLWLVAFSPYLLVLGGAVFTFNRLKKQQSRNFAQAPFNRSRSTTGEDEAS